MSRLLLQLTKRRRSGRYVAWFWGSRALLAEAGRIREAADVGAFIRRWFDGR
jgi:hypothetical protein